jgi:hypothetical protein
MTDQATTNILKAIQVVVDNGIPNVIDFYRSVNRINSVGDALELFAKDIFADSVNIVDLNKKEEKHRQVFSWGGNANNPPDFMIKGGDAVEVKKITSTKARIALNSSYPSAKLFASNPLLLSECRNCEDWKEKDIIYIIGCIDGKNTEQTLSSLWLIYGDCYAANKECYERIKRTIIDGIQDIQGVELSPTNELARVNKVDPLGITNLRVRGMWDIAHPSTLYKHLEISLNRKSFQMIVLMSKTKYDSCPSDDRDEIEMLAKQGAIEIRNIDIKSPNNTMQSIAAKLFVYEI